MATPTPALPEHVVIDFAGLAGHCAYGWRARDALTNEVLAVGCGRGQAGEGPAWLGCLGALAWLARRGSPRLLTLQSDAWDVVYKLRGRWECEDFEERRYRDRVLYRLRKLGLTDAPRFVWVRSDRNTFCRVLCAQAAGAPEPLLV